MRLDKQSILSDEQALAAVGSGTAVNSTNVIDLGDTGNIHGFSASAATNGRVPIRRKIGSKGQRFMAQLTEAMVGASGGLRVDFVSANNEDLLSTGSGNAATTVASITLPTASAAGTQIPWPNIPRYLTRRYFGLKYVPQGSNLTSCKITAGFVEDVPDHDY